LRSADSAIRAYLYQFDKALCEVLTSRDGQIVTLEGQIEDIDIMSDSGTEAFQCKYHEGEDFAISKVAEPILDMLCHFIKEHIIGKKTKYILYACFHKNVDTIEQDKLHEFILKTTDREIVRKYFTRIFNIFGIYR